MIAVTLVISVMMQSAPPPADPRYAWRLDDPVDAGFEDAQMLMDSGYIPMEDLRLPDAWDRVYRMNGLNGELFARRNGAVTAVFPRSDYLHTRRGVVPIVPPDTVYVIGEPPRWLLRQFGLDDGVEAAPSPTRLDLSLSTRKLDHVEADPLPVESSGWNLSMWSSERVRRARLRALLGRAAGGRRQTAP